MNSQSIEIYKAFRVRDFSQLDLLDKQFEFYELSFSLTFYNLTNKAEMAHAGDNPNAGWKNYIVTEGNEEMARDQCMSFQDFVRQPTKKRQQKDQLMLPRISKKHQLLPDLMSKQAKVSNAAKQWEISQETNMTNSLQINKIVSEHQQALENVKFTEQSQKCEKGQPKGLKLSFRKRVIQPTSNSVNKMGKNLSSPFFINRDQATASYSLMDSKDKQQGTYRKHERRLEPLSSNHASTQQTKPIKLNI